VQSTYARSKGTGEKAVMAAFPQATILRPSVLFGEEDNFFNQFAKMASFLPFLPLIGGGKTLFQPVYVADVAKAIVACLERTETKGKTYELGGPASYSFKQLLEYIGTVTGLSRRFIPIPWSVAKLIGWISEILPKPFLTRDQVTLLKHDNTVQAERDGFTALNLTPTALELIVPRYLQRFRRNVAQALHTTEITLG
jgi:NADH dehydrogenase